jgi:hypothetical protein
MSEIGWFVAVWFVVALSVAISWEPRGRGIETILFGTITLPVWLPLALLFIVGSIGRDD